MEISFAIVLTNVNIKYFFKIDKLIVEKKLDLNYEYSSQNFNIQNINNI